MRAVPVATLVALLAIGCGGQGDTLGGAPDVRGTDLLAALKTLRSAGYEVRLCGPTYTSTFLRVKVTDQRTTAPKTVQLETDEELPGCDFGD